MVKQLEDMTEDELWKLLDSTKFTLTHLVLNEFGSSQQVEKLEEIEVELTRRDKLNHEEVGFELADECCDECKWVSQVENGKGTK